MYLVAYIKIADNKRDGIEVSDIYFGGIGTTEQDADILAQKCIEMEQGGIVVPKCIDIENDIKNGLKTMIKHFDHIIDGIYENADKLKSQRKLAKR